MESGTNRGLTVVGSPSSRALFGQVGQESARPDGMRWGLTLRQPPVCSTLLPADHAGRDRRRGDRRGPGGRGHSPPPRPRPQAAPWRRGRLGDPDLTFTFVAQKTTDFRVTDSAAVLLSLYQETPSYFLMVDRLRRTQCLHLPHAPQENNHHDEPHHSARSFSAE